MRLGSSAQLGTSIATFSADGAHHLSEENHLIRTMQCVPGLGPMAKTSAPIILLGPLPPHACQQRTLAHHFQQPETEQLKQM